MDRNCSQKVMRLPGIAYGGRHWAQVLHDQGKENEPAKEADVAG